MSDSRRTVRIDVGPEGEVKTEFGQFEGATCLDAAQHLHELLAQFGVEEEQTSFTPKPELQAARVQAAAHEEEALPTHIQQQQRVQEG